MISIPWPLGESWLVLDLNPKNFGAVRRVIVKVTRTDGHLPELRFSVMEYGNDRQGFPYLGSFGGRLQCTDMNGVHHYKITDGSMYLPEDYRDLSIGTWCQNEVIRWVKSLPPGLIVPISLSENDASTESRKNLRNRFYEQFGIEFAWSANVAPGVAGRSFAHPTSALVERTEIPRIHARDLRWALNAAVQDAAHSARQLSDLALQKQWLLDRLAEIQNRAMSLRRWLLPLALGFALGSALALSLGCKMFHSL